MNRTDVNRLHEASLKILGRTGVAFYSETVLEVFKRHGLPTDGHVVYFPEKIIQNALTTAPSTFRIRARNPIRDITAGGGAPPILAPGYGAPFMVDRNGKRNKATIEDYRRFCKLVQTSDVIDINGFLMVDPGDLDPDVYHLDMLLNNVLLSDKPFMGCPFSKACVLDSLAMASIAFGKNAGAMMVFNINAQAPLQYAGNMAEALMTCATYGQPAIITGGGILGATAPITVSGMLAAQNAAVLAGIALAQLIRPGAPVIYGLGGTNMDMQSGNFYAGSPEAIQALKGGAALARFYDLPSKCGGAALNDAPLMDYQAGYQSTLALSAAISAGVSFVLHACGMLGTFMSMSLTKFVADEAVCRHLAAAAEPVDTSHAAAELESIKAVGIGGEYITHVSTLRRCRTAFASIPLANRYAYDQWSASGEQDYNQRASRLAADRLNQYQKPPIDPDVVHELTHYVKSKKKALWPMPWMRMTGIACPDCTPAASLSRRSWRRSRKRTAAGGGCWRRSSSATN